MVGDFEFLRHAIHNFTNRPFLHTNTASSTDIQHENENSHYVLFHLQLYIHWYVDTLVCYYTPSHIKAFTHIFLTLYIGISVVYIHN